ncbi:MAG: PHP domain-containing protein, partial [Oscillospiraceae bacterium]|nr:PHP domain-containing protein [Oscillospiraceae bacterium]
MQTLREFLREYAVKLPENVLEGKIRRVLSNRERSKLYFETEYPAPLPFAQLSETENELANRLELGSCRILCRYPAESFSAEVLPELFLTLRRELPMINGFLEDAGLELKDGVLSITLMHGGAEILEQTHFREELARAVHTIFSVPLTVQFAGDHLHVTAEEQSQMQSEVLAALPPEQRRLPQEPQPVETPVFSALTQLTPDAEPVTPDRPDKESLNVLYGRVIKEKPVTIGSVVQQIGMGMGGKAAKFAITCEVFAKPESRVLKNGKTLLTFPVTDYTGSLLVKMFLDEEKLKDFPSGDLKKGTALMIFGTVEYSDYDRDITMKPNSINSYKAEKRTDDAPVKRVELHLHTNMSAMDAVTSAEALVCRAHDWGHRAIAITDHGVVQAFPEAMNTAAKWKDFRVIYGCEAYVVNDLERIAVIDQDDPRTPQDEVIVFDVETTGLSPQHDRLTEIGAVKIRGMRIIDSFDTFVNPEREIPQFIQELTHITQ